MLNLVRICGARCFVQSRASWVRAESCKPNLEDNENIWVGPPHPISNLRPTHFPKKTTLTNAEKKYFAVHSETQSWNQHYWELHNSEFEKAREAFIKEYKQQRKATETENVALTAEELSTFYRSFLNKNHKKHMQYNWEWYRRNFHLVYLAAKAHLSKMFHFNNRKNIGT